MNLMFHLLFVVFIMQTSPPFEASLSKVHCLPHHHPKGFYGEFTLNGPQNIYHPHKFATLHWIHSYPRFKPSIKIVVKNKLFNLITH